MQFNLKHNSQLCSHKVLIVSYVLHCLLCVDYSVESCNVIVNGISSKVGDGLWTEMMLNLFCRALFLIFTFTCF